MLIAGIDVGLTLVEPTSGVAKIAGRRFVVAHTTCDLMSREEALGYRPGRDPPIDVLAVDGPVLPEGELRYEPRPCEKVLVWGTFQRRCKPGESQIRGTGRALRRGGCDTARQFGRYVSGADRPVAFPRVQAGRNVVEAFPNAFLGVLLPDEAFVARIARGAKCELLFEQCAARGTFDELRTRFGDEGDGMWKAIRGGAIDNRDERAAVVCLVTALCVWHGRYVAVGEPRGGYVFLPPWSLWAGWARSALDENRRDARLGAPVEVWIDGERFSAREALPRT